MADERCETCGAEVSQMGSGGPTPPDPFIQHLQDFNDPHRTLDLVAKKYYGVTAPVVDPTTYRPGDWYFNLDNGNGYVFKVTNDGYEWRIVISPTHVDIDLTQYATKAWVEAGFVSTSYASEHFLTQVSLSNYVTAASMASALASYATQQYVATAIASSGHMTMVEADLRYMRAASEEDQFVSRSQLTTALAAYTPSVNLATYLQLSSYLTIAAADAADGFARKSALEQLNFVTPAALSSALSSYATQAWVGNLGYLTQTIADQRYLQVPAVPYITAGYVTNALAAYTPSANLAAYLNLSSFLTIAAADGPDGFIRKNQAGSLNYVTQTQLQETVAGLVSQSSLPAVKQQIASQVLADVSRDYATKADVEAIVVSQGANIIYRPEIEGGKYVLRDRANNVITLEGTSTVVPVRLPPRAAGVSRDFLVVIDFSSDGMSAWAETSFTVEVYQITGELPLRKLFAAEPGVLTTDVSSYIAANTRVILGFTETSDCEFMVTRKVVSDLEPPLEPAPADDEEKPSVEGGK